MLLGGSNEATNGKPAIVFIFIGHKLFSLRFPFLMETLFAEGFFLIPAN